MDLILKDIPEQCEERIKQVARNIVEGFKISQIQIPKVDMVSFDVANKMFKEEVLTEELQTENETFK